MQVGEGMGIGGVVRVYVRACMSENKIRVRGNQSSPHQIEAMKRVRNETLEQVGFGNFSVENLLDAARFAILNVLVVHVQCILYHELPRSKKSQQGVVIGFHMSLHFGQCLQG